MTEYDYFRVSHERQADIKAWVTTLGLEPGRVASRFEVDANKVHLRVYELNSEGKKYIDPDTDEVASRLVSVPLAEAPSWLQPERSMAG